MPWYRYVHHCWLDRFLGGEIRFMPLSHYQQMETGAGDRMEATRLHEPDGGLQIRKGGEPWVQIPNSRWTSAIPAEKVYISCLSQVLSNELFDKFSADRCVEIRDTEGLTRRIRSRVRAYGADCSPEQDLVIKHGPVHYYDHRQGPGTSYMRPERIALEKRAAGYEDEVEYRFSFAERQTWGFGKTSMSLQIGSVGRAATGKASPAAIRVTSIGATATHKRLKGDFPPACGLDPCPHEV